MEQIRWAQQRGAKFLDYFSDVSFSVNGRFA